MLGTTLPTPLYVIYQAQWHFPAAIITLIFAVYAAGVLAALLLAGRSSDQAGRKPVLAVALGASALSTVVFILAPDVGVLLVGRILSGLSAGLMTGTATAALTNFGRRGRHGACFTGVGAAMAAEARHCIARAATPRNRARRRQGSRLAGRRKSCALARTSRPDSATGP